jgi:hypothetical protein
LLHPRGSGRLFSFSLDFRNVWISSFISLMTQGSFNNVLFSLYVFEYFL